MSKLSVRNLKLSRGGDTVLQDISFDVATGELLVVIGPSGGGKSSLLRCINRLNDIDSGTIHLDGDSIYDMPVPELRRRVGMMFQKTAAFRRHGGGQYRLRCPTAGRDALAGGNPRS